MFLEASNLDLLRRAFIVFVVVVFVLSFFVGLCYNEDSRRPWWAPNFCSFARQVDFMQWVDTLSDWMEEATGGRIVCRRCRRRQQGYEAFVA